MCTDLGLTTVNIIEAFNSVLAKFRFKDHSWNAVDGTLASFMAFLSWQESHVKYWVGSKTEYKHRMVEVAEEVMRMVPILDITFSKRDLKVMDTKLTRQLMDMNNWRNPAKRAEKCRQRRVRKGWTSGSSEGYVGGGTSAGLQAAVAAAVRFAPAAGLADFYAAGVVDTDRADVDEAVTERDRDECDEERGMESGEEDE